MRYLAVHPEELQECQYRLSLAWNDQFNLSAIAKALADLHRSDDNDHNVQQTSHLH